MTLLRKHTGDAVEKVSLKSEGQRGAGMDDLFACLGHVDFLNGLSGHSAVGCLAHGGHEPAGLLVNLFV